MQRKYLVQPGWVRSQNDWDRHYIDARTLMRLYGVDPSECTVGRGAGLRPGAIVLAPRYDGNYSLPTHEEKP